MLLTPKAAPTPAGGGAGSWVQGPGTGDPPYKVTLTNGSMELVDGERTMADGNFKMHSICMMGEYNMYSPEELQLQDVSNGGKKAAAGAPPGRRRRQHRAARGGADAVGVVAVGIERAELMFNGDLSGRFWETSGRSRTG